MDLTGALRIPLPPFAVAEALDDVALLRASLDHCESFARRPSGEYALVVTVPVGPLRGRYEFRAHVANPDDDGLRAAGAKPLSRTLNFKASATGVGSLRGQIDIELDEDAFGANEGKGTGSDEGDKGDKGDDRGSGATRIQYAVWATLTGPLAELAPRQVENALHVLADEFFAEFSAVVEAKHGKRPNRARMGPGRRQHVFLRPISLAGLARRPASDEALETPARRAGDTLVGKQGAQNLPRRAPQVMPAWAWAAAFAVSVALLYVLHQFE